MGLFRAIKTAYRAIIRDSFDEVVQEEVDKVEKKWSEMGSFGKLWKFYGNRWCVTSTVLAAFLCGGALAKGYIDLISTGIKERENISKIYADLETQKANVESRAIDVVNMREIAGLDKILVELDKSRIELSEKIVTARKNLAEMSMGSSYQTRAELSRLEEAAKDIESMHSESKALYEGIKLLGRPLACSYDLNENLINDSVDLRISKEMLNGMKILSPEFISSVRLVYSPDVIANLAEYGITGPVVCVNEDTLLVCNGGDILKIIKNVPKEKLNDFVVKPGNSSGVDAILKNKIPYAPALVSIQAYCPNSKTCSGGSGIVLGNGYIATAWHVVSDSSQDRLTVQFENGKYIEGSADSIIAYSSEHDLAVLKLDFDGYLPVALEDNLRPGDAVQLSRSEMSCNSHRGRKEEGTLHSVEQILFDHIAGKENHICGRDVYLTTLSIYNGDSGSGVLDGQGRLVGIASSTSIDKAGASTIRRAKYLRQLLESYKEKSK